MSDLQKAVFRLVSSPHYQKLATYKPPFDPFDVMGVLYREHNHSKVLGWLLSDETNREFRQEFISWIVDKLKNYNLSVGTEERVEIKPEYGDEKAGRIDVFAHFPDLKLGRSYRGKSLGRRTGQPGRALPGLSQTKICQLSESSHFFDAIRRTP